MSRDLDSSVLAGGLTPPGEPRRDNTPPDGHHRVCWAAAVGDAHRALETAVYTTGPDTDWDLIERTALQRLRDHQHPCRCRHHARQRGRSGRGRGRH